MYYDCIETELGNIMLLADHQGLRQLSITSPSYSPNEIWQHNPEFMAPFIRQLKEYLIGSRKKFTFPLAPQGTLFQQQIWHAIADIPYGETVTYEQIAANIGNTKATQAIGMAKNVNPIPIVIPCHRVLNSHNSLCGYRYGEEIVALLLALEAGDTILLEEHQNDEY
ncbi:6-O-methylguanine DNA methyltransferase [Photobacterium iliopiscarium]|jgi:methylated-DNA-[protein]-cysteine S-methyltransferase|uniref:methylated-DNA--[protein]-cysteine S-methyltransferase n=2 Tax=Photobacterium iliopiscarium TaxID=56192 RepID=A0A0D8Q622_9GAMM|nr:methylated-DNA--[protein]-cysteine S-methyltransferase [Photobacterium iliopiscarium]KJG14677.1 6-O-methylguanine DNA methyltransferase [Photobacterium iliopiscarium]KJG26591.1 6-O-methylguanine DNA methyltransferase [Photobacterium iliopiscarium]MCD9466698.1 6-O-methylguanine DNA methyltransferase [Photobacterium iliopiscarium]MCD9486441.1 methylated-DNA--[protein]-cysteine S-methyltransferase [Photobacterium iliopiscarium]MCF2243928.1 methylated-DNA--[protein]-cysteine S-methyltransferase